MKQSKRRSDTPELPPKGTTDRQFAVRFFGVIVTLGSMAGLFGLIAYTTQHHEADLHSEQERSAIAHRLAAPGAVATDAAMLEAAAPAAATPASGPPKSGDETVQQVCSACHQAGVLGAPKIGDTAAWKARLQASGGRDGLVKSASHGKGNMPPRGGRADLSDQDLRAAIDVMLKKSGA